jgi:rubredoxin
MARWVCTRCQAFFYVDGVEKVDFKDLPDDFVCPVCGAKKSKFAEQIHAM